MKHSILIISALLLTFVSCKDKYVCTQTPSEEEDLITPQVRARITEQVGEDQPFTGILEIYPCKPGTSEYYGNYINGKLSIFNGFYTIVKGDVFGTSNREIHLPLGDYNMVYWGTPKHEEPIHNEPQIQEPGITQGADLSEMYFSLRPYGDGTYRPVYDLVHAIQETDIGSENLQTALVRVSAGLIVNLRQKNNAVFNSRVKDIKVQIGSIAEKLNFYTAQPEGNSRTIAFPLVRSTDGKEMTNGIVMTFPSFGIPELQVLATLQNGQIKTFKQKLNAPLEANNKLTLSLSIGDILEEEDEGSFTIDDWNENNEEINVPVLE